jgi:ceramide glucosyltransferase
LNLLAILPVLCALWWGSAVAVLLLSFAAALAHPLRKERPTAAGEHLPLSAVVPIEFMHCDFGNAQRSLFAQDYEGLEIVFSARRAGTPAIAAASRIRDEFPAIQSRFVQSHGNDAVSPKLNTMWQGICDARNDLILTKDSNLSLGPGEVADLVRHFRPGVGLVSAISIATDPQSFAAWIETSIINCYHARILMLGDAAGLGFGLGKVMLFRRSDLMRAGGFDELAWALGEDMALARAMGGLGLRTVLAARVSRQKLGRRSFSDLWRRQLRWMVVWRVQLPAVFAGDMLGAALPTALVGAVAASFFGFAPGIVALGTLAGWFCVEFLLCAAKGWPLSPWSPIAFIAREMLTPVLWLRACTTSQVVWAGAVRKAVRKAEFAGCAGSQAMSRLAADRNK